MKSHYEEGEEEDEPKYSNPITKKSNVLPLWGNERSMNLNPLILTNIQSSHYFKVNLYELKTYHEVIDEIYYKVAHLEPWEKGSRKTAGQTGMCGGVRGVGAGGIVSTAYCLLYKLFTLKLTRKQLNGLITHTDSPYIRALGFMYISERVIIVYIHYQPDTNMAVRGMFRKYTQPPADLWDWYDEYLDDPEEVDVKAGGGQVMTMGNILKTFLCKLEWFSTLFPRIPVPIQMEYEDVQRVPHHLPLAKLRQLSHSAGEKPGFLYITISPTCKAKIERNMNAKYPGGVTQKPPPRNNSDEADYEPEKHRHGRFVATDRTVEDKRERERVRTPDRDRKNVHADPKREFGRDRPKPLSRDSDSLSARERDRHPVRDRDRLSRDRDRYSRDSDRYSRDSDRHFRESGDRHSRESSDQTSSRDWKGSRDRESHHSRHNGDKRRPRSRSPNRFKSRHH